jgi:hypothetical protein
LVDVDALNLGAVHLDGMTGNDAALQDDALIGDGKLGAGATDGSGNEGDEAEQSEERGKRQSCFHIRAKARVGDGEEREQDRYHEKEDRATVDEPVKAGGVDHPLAREQDFFDVTHSFPFVANARVAHSLPFAGPCIAGPVCISLRQPPQKSMCESHVDREKKLPSRGEPPPRHRRPFALQREADLPA